MEPINTVTRRYLGAFSLFLLSLIFGISPQHVEGNTSVPVDFSLGDGLATITTPLGKIVYAEIADTPDKRAQGLMFRTVLAPDHGMLFKFPELGYWTFWMKNTKISLDIIWMDEVGKIIHIEPRVPICTRKDDGCPRYHSHKKSLYVLEIKGGMAEKLGLNVDAPLILSFPQKSLPF